MVLVPKKRTREGKNPIILKILDLIGTEHCGLKLFCAKAGISPRTLSVNISRNDVPTIGTLLAISEAYNIPLGELCKGYEYKTGFRYYDT